MNTEHKFTVGSITGPGRYLQRDREIAVVEMERKDAIPCTSFVLRVAREMRAPDGDWQRCEKEESDRTTQ